MRIIYLVVLLCFFSSKVSSAEYFFKKITELNVNGKSVSDADSTIKDSRSTALYNAKLNNRIYMDGKVLSIPGVCVLKIRSDIPKKREKSDLDSIDYVKKKTGDYGEYLNVDSDKVDFFVKSESENSDECGLFYHIFIKIDNDIIFDYDGWGVIYTSDKSKADFSNGGYNIGRMNCLVINSDDGSYERHDACNFTGSVDDAYKEFYINKHDSDGWHGLLPSYRDVLLSLNNEKTDSFTVKAPRNNVFGEISITYALIKGEGLKLTSAMAGGETEVVFKHKEDSVEVSLSYYAD